MTPSPVDDEALGNSRRAERHLDPAFRLGADARERIAVAGEEVGDVLGPVADRQWRRSSPRGAAARSARALRRARHAPAGEDVDQSRACPGRKIGRGQPRLAGQCAGGEREGRHGLADQLATATRSSAGSPRRQATATTKARRTISGMKRAPAHAIAASPLSGGAAQAAPPAADKASSPPRRDEHAAQPDQGDERLPPQA